MIAFFIGLATRMLGDKAAARWVKPVAALLGVVAFALLIGAAVLAWNLWLNHHDDGVIDADRAKQNAAVTNAQLGAERVLGAEKRARDAAFEDQTNNLTEAAHAPITDDNRTALDALGDRMRDR